ncbi:MAG: carbon starvation CstA 5TM domain-containing protein [Cyanobacteriota/Melainabacteria group bacterium]
MSALAKEVGESSMWALNRRRSKPWAVGMGLYLRPEPQVSARSGGSHSLLVSLRDYVRSALHLNLPGRRNQSRTFYRPGFFETALEAPGSNRLVLAVIFSSALVVAGWGYFPLPGSDRPRAVSTRWAGHFGISNQLLAVVALCVGTTVIFRMDKGKPAW